MKKKTVFLQGLALICACFNMISCSNGGDEEYDETNFNETGDQIVKEKITLKFFVPKHSLHSNWGDMKLFQKMEEKTNIHIEFIEAPIASYSTLYAAYWNGGEDMPDAFFTYNDENEVAQNGRDGTIYEISEYLEKYAPNYTALMNSHPDWKARTMIDGNVYSTAMITDVPRDLTFKQFLNKKWIENINDIYLNDYGYSEEQLLSLNPSTLDEYTQILYAFKNEDANLNGNKNDEIPLSSYSMNQTRNFLLSAFGHVTTGFEKGKDGKVTHVQLSNDYRRYLEYTHQLYVDGVLDNRVFEKKSGDDLAINGNLLGSFDGAAAYLVAGAKYDKDYIAVQPLTSETNSERMWLKFSTFCTPSCIQIPTTTKYVKEIIRWLDYLYSEEGSRLASFGEEGVDWTWNDGSHTSFHFNVPEGKSIEEHRGTLTCSPGTGIPYWSKDFVLKEDGEYTSRINQVVEDAKYVDYLVEPLPYFILSEEDLEEIKFDLNEIETYCATFEAKVITGKIELTDKTWNDQIEVLKKCNLQKCIDIYQKYI